MVGVVFRPLPAAVRKIKRGGQTPGPPFSGGKKRKTRALIARRYNYGTSITGACQNATFCPVGSRTVTWQLYSPAGSFPSARLNFRGTALDLGSSPSTTASGGVSNALGWAW